MDKNTVAYVSDIIVSIGESYLSWSYKASRPVEILEPALNGQSCNNSLAHRLNNMDGNIKLKEVVVTTGNDDHLIKNIHREKVVDWSCWRRKINSTDEAWRWC